MELQLGMRIDMEILPKHGVSDYVSWDGCDYLCGWFNGFKYVIQITEDSEICELVKFEGDWESFYKFIENNEYMKDKYCRFSGRCFKYNGNLI